MRQPVLQIRGLKTQLMRQKLFQEKTLYTIALLNILGTVFGFYYYSEQLLSTPLHLWIFVPASPIATLLFASSIYLNAKNKGLPLLNALSFIANLKYGLWTVFCLFYYFETFFSGNSLLYSFMLASHLGMAVQAFLLFKWRTTVKALTLSSLWYLFNDFIDYSLGTHTELYTQNVFPAEIAAYSLTFLAFVSGLSLIQKDQILKKLREVRRV